MTAPTSSASPTLTVTADGWLRQGARCLPCALGRAGTTMLKQEGDGATPIGEWPLRRVFWRPDRLKEAPELGRSGLPLTAHAPDMGWCDDPAHADYNRLVTLPHPAGHETLWRTDHLYDIVVVLGYNDTPPEPGRGSAIFLHCARPDPSARHGLRSTAGCVALRRSDLLAVLANLPERPTLAVLLR